MPFPWGQPQITLFFTCPHCGETTYNEHGRVTVCHCPGAERERAEEKERLRLFHAQQEEAKPSMVQIRQQRKLRTGRKNQ